MGCAASGGAAPRNKDTASSPAGSPGTAPEAKTEKSVDAAPAKLKTRESKSGTGAEPSISEPAEPEPEEVPLRAREKGMKIVIVVDSFLNRECELEVWRDEGELPDRIDLFKGFCQAFPGESRVPKTLLVKGKEITLDKTPGELYDMIEHGGNYELSFQTDLFSSPRRS